MGSALCPLCGISDSVRALRMGPPEMVRCRQCGLVFCHPPPADIELSTPGLSEASLEAVEEEWLGERRSQNFRRLLDG